MVLVWRYFNDSSVKAKRRWRNKFIAWCPALLVMVWMLGRWKSPKIELLWSGMPIVFFFIGLLGLIVKMRSQRIRRSEITSAFAQALASLIAAEASLSVPLLLTAVALIGALGNLLESSNIPLLISVLAWLAFTTFMVLLLEPSSPSETAPKEGLPPLTRGLILFVSRKPPDSVKWETLKEMTDQLGSNKPPTFDDLKKLSEVIRARRGKGKNLSQPTNWIEALADTPFAPPLYAIAYHSERLEHLWLVVTSETEKEELCLLRKILRNLNAQFKIHELRLENPDDLSAIQRVINIAYHQAKELGLPESEVTTDITSGSALMSVGGVLACVRSQRRVQYLNQTTYELQEVPVSVENVAEAIQELLEQLPKLISKVPQKR